MVDQLVRKISERGSIPRRRSTLEAHTDWRRELFRKQLASALSVRLDSASAKVYVVESALSVYPKK